MATPPRRVPFAPFAKMEMSEFWLEARNSFHCWISDDLEYECAYCQITFQSSASLFRHVEATHKVDRGKYAADNPSYSVKKTLQNCLVCGTREKHIFAHLNGAHNGMKFETYFMRYIFRDESEPRQQQLRREESSLGPEEGKMQDTPCGTKDEGAPFSDHYQEVFQEHSDVVAGDQIKESMQSKLSVSKLCPATCNHCGQVFRYKWDLARHERLHLGKNLPHQCPHCSKSFNREHQLIGHLPIHTGVKPFPCVMCEKGFNFNHHLLNHVRVAHRPQ